MATRGPIPKPEAQRRRTNKKVAPVKKASVKATAKKTAAVVDPDPVAIVFEIPTADPTWHPIAISLYESLGKSGQSEFYQPTDWTTAFMVCDSISRDLSPQVVGFTPGGEILRSTIPMKGASLSAYLKAMTSLLMTEGDRRRAGLELQHGPQIDLDAERAAATVTDIGLRLASA